MDSKASRLHRVPGSGETGGKQADGPPPAVPTSSDSVLALQRAIGNRAVTGLVGRGPPRDRRLMRDPRRVTVKQAKRKGVPVTIVPDHRMDGRELAVLVLEQLYGETPAAAEQRLEQFEAHGGRRLGKTLQEGVTDAMVGKPVTIYVEPPRADPAAAEDVKLRAQDLAAMAPADRQRLNDEVDRRFWKKLGDAKRHKLGLGSDERAQRELWMQTRDEVLQQRDLLMVKPQAVRDFLSPTGAELDPKDYDQALRIAEKAKDLTEADWARYERNAVGITDDLSIAEESIGRFADRRAKEQAIADRVKGTEGIFTDWRLRARASVPRDWLEERVRLWLWANKKSFASMEDYDAACDDYLHIFRDRALEIAFLALRASESVVRAELARYRDPEGVKATYADLKVMRDIVEDARMQRAALDDPTTVDVDEANIERNLQLDLKAERERLTPQHPIFADTELATDKLSKADPETLASTLKSDAADRLHDIEKTRARFVRDSEAAFQLDNVVQATRKEMGAEKWDEIHGMIVSQHLTEIKQDHVLRSMAMTLLAIGLGLLTFGTGTVAVIAGGALLAQGVYLGADEVKAYGDAFSAAHTAFDSSQSLSSTAPSAFWAAFALISAGLDGTALTSALQAAGKPLRLLEETGSIKRFNTVLAEVGELSTGAKSVLARAMKAKPELDQATHSLRQALKEAEMLSTGANAPKVLTDVQKCGYTGAQLGMKRFEEFAAYAKATKLRPIAFEKLTADELTAMKHAYERGVSEAETAGVAIEPGEAAGGTPHGPADPGSSPPTERRPPSKDAGEQGNEPPGKKPPDKGEPPPAPGLGGFTSALQVHDAVANALQGLTSTRPNEWHLVVQALANGHVNAEIAELLPIVMDGLCNPELYGVVMAEAWERAMRNATDLETALTEIAMETGLPTQQIPRGQGLIDPPEFFRRYASAEAYFIDLPLAGDNHGSLTHLIQDLVVDRAFARAGRPMRSAEFRARLAHAEGEVTRDVYDTSEAMTFLDPPLVPVRETKMTTGDYVWRFTYDLILDGHMPQPENIWPRIWGVLFK